MLNFGVWLRGAAADYAEWGARVGDEEAWAWERVRRDFEAVECVEGVVGGYGDLAAPLGGGSGRVKVGLPRVLERGVREGVQALLESGERLCLDPNDGDPMGVSLFPASYGKDGRCTSAGAHLVDAVENLDVWTEASVTLFLWSEDGERVVGVQLQDGRRGVSFRPELVPLLTFAVYASKEVILCAGAIDSPRLLLVNGIGPRAELERVGVAVKKDLPGVGKHLQDHVLAFMSVEVDGALNDRWAFESNEALEREATAQWDKDRTGPLTLHHSCLWGGFLKHPDLASFPEYTALPAATQQFLAQPTVPTYEFINNCAAWPPGVQITPGHSYMTFIAFLMNPQSEGSVTLASPNPLSAPVIQLNFLTHPYDARIMREAVRATWTKIALNPTLQPHITRTLCGPASLADADVDAFVRDHANTVWHANGTVKMGRLGEPGTCVDTAYRVVGVKGLRVADLSVCPLTPNNHTQPTAYLIAYRAARRLVDEYGLA